MNEEDILKIYNYIAKSSQQTPGPQSQPNQVLAQGVYAKPQPSNLTSSLQLEGGPAKSIEGRRREKCHKGLRHFSMKVCEKVKQKGTTSYNEVADELVAEYCNNMAAGSLLGGQKSLDNWIYDQKNVRRRVYDALNVLMAMNIISKEKKEIKWIGLPCNKKQECQELEAEKSKKQESINRKREQLKELLLEHISSKMLANRNKTKVNATDEKIETPFIVLNMDKNASIECNIASDKKEYIIYSDSAFEICSHVDVLKKLGLCLKEAQEDDNNETCSLVPKLFEPYIKQLREVNELKTIICNNPKMPSFEHLMSDEEDEEEDDEDEEDDDSSRTSTTAAERGTNKRGRKKAQQQQESGSENDEDEVSEEESDEDEDEFSEDDSDEENYFDEDSNSQNTAST